MLSTFKLASMWVNLQTCMLRLQHPLKCHSHALVNYTTAMWFCVFVLPSVKTGMRRFLIEFLAAKVLKDLNMMAVEDLRVSKFSLGHT